MIRTSQGKIFIRLSGENSKEIQRLIKNFQLHLFDLTRMAKQIRADYFKKIIKKNGEH